MSKEKYWPAGYRKHISELSTEAKTVETAPTSPLPRITIVTPSYNQGKYIEQTILSVLNQNYPNLEYIIMDGGSIDGSVAIIKKYEKFLSYWCSEKDEGQADAIHRGFKKGTGEILGWVNSDDLLMPGCLSSVAQYFLHHPHIDCVVGNAVGINEYSKMLGDPLGLPWVVFGRFETYNKLLYRGGMGFSQPASFWRRKPYFDIDGLDTSKQFALDYDLFLRLAKLKPFDYLNQTLACFRMHNSSKTANLQHIRKRESTQILSILAIHPLVNPVHFIIQQLFTTWSIIRSILLRSAVKLRLINL